MVTGSPEDQARRFTVDVLPEQDAVALIQATTGEFRDADSPANIAELVRLCSYLPLALRIAAERAASRPGMPPRRNHLQQRPLRTPDVHHSPADGRAQPWCRTWLPAEPSGQVSASNAGGRTPSPIKSK